MGKTKMAVIDDSIPQTEAEKPRKTSTLLTPRKVNPNPELEETRVKSKQSFPIADAKGEESSDKQEITKSEPKVEAKSKQVKTPKKSQKIRSKKYKEASEKIEKSKRYSVLEAIDLAKQSSYSKFDGSLELHLNTNSKNIRGLVSLPFTSGKKLKVLVFGPPSLKASEGQAKELEELGAEVGDDDKLNEIIRGITGFDVIVTTAEWMPKLARAAKVLGPRGLMPSPKNGTITDDLKKAVSEIQSGKVEYKTQKDSQVVHLSIGKVSQSSDQIAANMKILFNTIGKTRIKKAVISPSMGMGVKVDLASI